MDLNQNKNIPFFKKIDALIFTKIDQFKLTPNYSPLQDFYNGLEEEQQKLFKASVVLAIIGLPLFFNLTLAWQNYNLRQDLTTRISLINKANEILGQNKSFREVSPTLLSQSPIDSDSMMSSRLSNVATGIGLDLSKVQVTDFVADKMSENIFKAQADLVFNNFSTDELMSLFTALIQREKFRVESVDIKRNNETNLLGGQFRLIHLSNANTQVEEE